MEKFYVYDLIPHPQNEFFFDDVTGQKWEEFLESIRTSGVIEPPVVTGEKVIVSGHQRVRACKELGIEHIDCRVVVYDDQDRVIKDLIETNIRQRGTIAGSDLKMGRIIKELERIYGIRNGVRMDLKLPTGSEAKSQEDLAKELGMSVDKLNLLKKLAELPEEYQQMVMDGSISTKTASRVIARLSESDQLALLEKLPAAERFTQAQIQRYIEQIQDKDKQIADLQAEAVEAVRAVKAGSDSEEYIKAKKAKEEADEKYRLEFEKHQTLQSKVQEDQQKAAAKLKEVEAQKDRQIEMLQEQLAKAVERFNGAQGDDEETEAPDVIEVEVYPEDYERIKSENERLVREIRTMEDLNRRIAADNASRIESNFVMRRPFEDVPENENDLERYYDRVVKLLSEVTPEIDSVLVGAERFEIMTVIQRETIANRVNECVRSLNQMMSRLKTNNKEAA